MITKSAFPQRELWTCADRNLQFSRLFSGKPQKEVQDAAGIDLKEFKRVFERGMAFTSGTATDCALLVLYPVTRADPLRRKTKTASSRRERAGADKSSRRSALSDK